MIIVDTSVLVAFFNKKDGFFDKASETLKRQDWPLVLIEPVVNETLALLRKRVNKQTAVAAAAQMQNLLLFDLVIPEREEVDRAMAMFIKHGGKYSYVDLVVTLITERLSGKVLTFDSHYQELGAEVIS